MMGTAIGIYGVTFNKRSEFIYKTITPIESLFLRKVKWHNILSNGDIKGFVQIIKNHIKSFYLLNINQQLRENKEKQIRKFTLRADYENVLSVQGVKMGGKSKKSKDQGTPGDAEKLNQELMNGKQGVENLVGNMNLSSSDEDENQSFEEVK